MFSECRVTDRLDLLSSRMPLDSWQCRVCKGEIGDQLEYSLYLLYQLPTIMRSSR